MFIPLLFAGTKTLMESETKATNVTDESDLPKNIQTTIGNRESPAVLLTEYNQNPGFLPKINTLIAKYKFIRRSRGDGNCFYRAVAFQILNHLRQSTPAIVTSTIKKHNEILDGFVNFFQYQRFTVEDYCEMFCEFATELQGKELSALETIFQDEMNTMYLVYWMRLLTSYSIQSKAESFLPFISALGFSDAGTFCKAQVEPVNGDADQLQIQALAEFMGWNLLIEYLDGSSGELNHHSFGSQEENAFEIVLLYRPGHYDMLSL